MHHVTHYTAVTTTAVLTELTAVQDQVFGVTNSHLFPYRDINLLAFFAHSANLRRIRWNTPKTRGTAIPWVPGIDRAALPPDNPMVADYMRSPWKFIAEEEIIIEALQDAGADQRVFSTQVWQFPNDAGQLALQPMPQGDVFTLRATSATVLTALVWSDVVLTFDQQLASGRYAIVGAQCFSATGEAFRFITDDTYYRSGGIMQLDQGGRPWEGQRPGALGIWSYFRTVSLPRLQIFALAADTASELWIQVMRVG